MTKQKKVCEQPWKGRYTAIARKVGCSSKYVSLVLNCKLGKYSERETELVNQIRQTNTELEKMFNPEK